MPELNLDFDGVASADIDEGWHSVRIFGVELKESKAGNRMLNIQLKIEGGPWDKRSLFDHLMLETDAIWRTRQVLEVLGLMEKDDVRISIDTEDFIGLECEVRTVNEEYEGQLRPRIKNYRAVTGNTLEALAQ